MPPRPSLLEIFLVALRLGCTSFGGPVAHLAFFRKEYVEKRRWLDEAHFADLVALCQFLPGPASSQTGFGIGYIQRGLVGGCAAALGFTLPSAALMIGFAHGLASFGNLETAGWLRGLKVAAVGIVAQAVWVMGRNLCPDWPRRGLALIATALLLGLPQTWIQLAVIATGAAAGWVWYSSVEAQSGCARPDADAPRAQPDCAPTARSGTVCLLLFFALLLGLPAIVRITNIPPLEVFDRFYRAGALVFGGGHVILPLLEREVVTPGWLTHDQFLAGYGAAQAMPGPLFTLSAYLGAVMNHGSGGATGAAWALLGMFLPALLLVAGVLPFWQGLRRQVGVQAALRGANATVVGVLLAAFYHPVWTSGIAGGRSLGLAIAAFVALRSGKIPVWAVVLASAGLGGALL